MRKFSLVILVLSLSSCYTQKRATMQVVRAHTVFPVVVADYCAKQYPPNFGIGRADTILQYDTLIEEHHFFSKTRDTVTVERIKTITRTETVTRVDTVENSAKAEALWGQIQALNLDLVSEQKKHKQWKNTGMALMALIVLLGVGAVMKFVLKLRSIRA